MTEPLSAQELSSAPAIIRHLAAHGRRATVDTTITACSHGYRVTISSAKQDRRIQAHLIRKGRRWWQELAFFEGDTEVDVEGGLAEMMRLLSKAGDRVGSPGREHPPPGHQPHSGHAFAHHHPRLSRATMPELPAWTTCTW